MVTWGTIHERFKYGVKKYGWKSEFNNEYQSLCMQLRFHELDEFFDNWKVKILLENLTKLIFFLSNKIDERRII